jgi:hypothetical protein
MLAKIPRETTKTSACGCGERAERVEAPRAGGGAPRALTKDITGGLPRVVELFEASKRRETPVISEIDDVLRHGAWSRGSRRS